MCVRDIRRARGPRAKLLRQHAAQVIVWLVSTDFHCPAIDRRVASANRLEQVPGLREARRFEAPVRALSGRIGSGIESLPLVATERSARQ